MPEAIIHITITATPDRSGVGKSTVAEIIGYALQQQGIKVSMEDEGTVKDQFEATNMGLVNRAIESRMVVIDNRLPFKKPSLRAKPSGEIFIRD